MWIPGPTVTPKTPVKLKKIELKRFDLLCIICGTKNKGGCIQCQYKQCKISFHVECARRSNYFLEVERLENRGRNFRSFCEKHRPLKMVKELEERDRQAHEEVYKFAKVIDRCLEVQNRLDAKSLKSRLVAPLPKPAVPPPPTKEELAR